MRSMKKLSPVSVFLFCLYLGGCAGSGKMVGHRAFMKLPQAEVHAGYSPQSHIIGKGWAKKSDHFLGDKTVAEVNARLEIAKQIKVRIQESSFELRCEKTGSLHFDNEEECKNEFHMLVEETVDVFLEGSQIVSYGEEEGMIFAVAVLPRAETAKGLEENIEDSIRKVRKAMEKVKEGDKGALQTVQEEYMKALVYEREKGILEETNSRALALFEELDKEIANLK